MDTAESGRVDAFVHHLRYERRLSPETCKHYRRDLVDLEAWCDKTGLASWHDLDSEHLRSYSAACFRRGLAPRTIQRRLSAARTFFRYLLREKHVRRNPAPSPTAPDCA